MISSMHISKRAAAAASYLLGRRRGFSTRPWLMLPPSNGYNYFSSVGEEKVVRVKQNGGDDGGKGWVVGASQGWVVEASQWWGGLCRRWFLSLSISNPVTGEHMKLPSPPEKSFSVDNVILTSSPSLQDCAAAMIFNHEDLTFCAPGHPSATWTASTTPVSGYYLDFVYSRRNAQLLCLTQFMYHTEPCSNGLEAWDLSDPSHPRIAWWESLCCFGHDWLFNPFSHHCLRQRQYLAYVEPTDELLLVTRYYAPGLTPDGEFWGKDDMYPNKTMGFQVRFIDRRRRKVVSMGGSLGGLALFVGRNETLAVAAADFPGLQPDSIYFTHSDCFMSEDDPYVGHDIGIFDYNTGTISSCYYPCHYDSFKKIMWPVWVTPSSS